MKNIQPNLNQDAISSQTSGAYIFRTSEANEIPTRICNTATSEPCVVQLSVTITEDVIMIYQNISAWAAQVIYLYAGDIEVEFEYVLGSIPIDDNVGKEIITELQSNLDNGDKYQFFSDSNGREFQERLYNYRPTWDMQVFEPIAGNYYPLSTSCYIKDESKGLQLSIITDRALGAGALNKGRMEVMIQRRLVVGKLAY